MKQIPAALTIAGTDPSGGAGIQADLKTFQELKAYGMSVITSVVAQNTTGVQDVEHMPISLIKQQLESVISDVPFQAFKTGMLANIDIMDAVAEKITGVGAHYIMDPVMVTTSGHTLIAEDSREYLRENLLPLTTLVTPNIPEAEVIIDGKIETARDMQAAAKQIVHEYGTKAALVKGGHMQGEAVDFLYDGQEVYTFSTERIDTKNTHGTGCTYAAAITAYLSHGYPLPEAVQKAKAFVTTAIRHSFSIGAGSGPTNQWAHRVERVM
ncbi:bifunctional hydroxymethylpyrimidine kinase/phosphomethylpyrimidine kinase [Lentibacillus sp. CBA3610]|uniref:bifunctional hydroxymethylpyrimidine kinase/phosphomethylpyrimidine kinase n=1 Tax=Lentibacillus sp. CBA3610 TaxID=2518176 RepID=UPI00159608B2|nr:bifunctional hydroxymethylpyrimidine kinase/phosphomethylpyrimidine kinase [Lentibacillus sp. CBA3610]QKY71775.1 bifunctional hydroxymethylpyrimidine kinase/phosphomethylpyrimidine kinase [Lentibacillus sp. CBA3610]